VVIPVFLDDRFGHIAPGNDPITELLDEFPEEIEKRLEDFTYQNKLVLHKWVNPPPDIVNPYLSVWLPDVVTDANWARVHKAVFRLRQLGIVTDGLLDGRSDDGSSALHLGCWQAQNLPFPQETAASRPNDTEHREAVVEVLQSLEPVGETAAEVMTGLAPEYMRRQRV
jgi:hypothetical protein